MRPWEFVGVLAGLALTWIAVAGIVIWLVVML
jgi:hypothetical protein